MRIQQGGIDIRFGRWQDTLADVESFGSLITDPPYLGAGKGNGGAWAPGAKVVDGSIMPYAAITTEELEQVCEFSRKATEWVVVFNDFDGVAFLRQTLKKMGAVVAEPIGWLKARNNVARRGCVILPEKGTEFICVARFGTMKTWHTLLPGGYTSNPVAPNQCFFAGVKPLHTMRQIVEHYSSPNSTVVDLYSGSGTTAVACAQSNRQMIGSELNIAHQKIALSRLRQQSLTLVREPSHG